MGMFLMLLGLAVVVTALQGVILSYLWRESRTPAPPMLDAADVVGPPQFFQMSVGRSRAARPGGSHQYPTVASLHKHTASPLLH
jgi:hypothetical protein